MKKILLIGLALTSIGCNKIEENKVGLPWSNAAVSSLNYVRDNRTNLCFAVGWFRDGNLDHATGGPVIVLVPDSACDK